MRTFQFVTLLGMWIIPLILCLRNHWWRFIFIWLLFSCITSLIVRKALQKTDHGDDPKVTVLEREIKNKTWFSD
jgi:RING finger protein 121